mgnify:CR=1 FL=1
MDEKIVYLNGSFVPESEAKVSVLESGVRPEFSTVDGQADPVDTRHRRRAPLDR